MSAVALADPLRHRLAQVEARIADWWPEHAEVARAAGSPRPSLPPRLVVYSAECCGGAGEATTALAAAVELLSVALAAHDAVREDGPVARRRLGWSPNTAAILMGDYLLVGAFGILTDLNQDRWTLQLAEVVQAHSQARMRELTAPAPLGPDELLRVAQLRGALLAFSGRAGAESVGAPRETAALLGRFGECLGAALALDGAPALLPHSRRLRAEARHALSPLPPCTAREWLAQLTEGAT